MTIKEYNEKWYPLYLNSSCLLRSYNHALSKCNDYTGAINQLEIIGLSNDTINYLIEAVCMYDTLKRQEIK